MALSKLTERGFERQVITYAELMGWHVWKDRATNQRRTCAGCGAELRCGRCGRAPTIVRNDAGLLDLLLVRRPRVIWAELKSARGRLTPEQQATLALLRACDQEAYVWRPSSWPELERLLR